MGINTILDSTSGSSVERNISCGVFIVQMLIVAGEFDVYLRIIRVTNSINVVGVYAYEIREYWV